MKNTNGSLDFNIQDGGKLPANLIYKKASDLNSKESILEALRNIKRQDFEIKYIYFRFGFNDNNNVKEPQQTDVKTLNEIGNFYQDLYYKI